MWIGFLKNLNVMIRQDQVDDEAATSENILCIFDNQENEILSQSHLNDIHTYFN